MVKIENRVVMNINFDANLKSDLYLDAIIAELAAAGMAVITTGIIRVIPVMPRAVRIKNTNVGNTTNR